MLQARTRRGQRDREITFIQKVLEESESNEDKVDYWELVGTDPVVYALKEDMSGNDVLIADRATYMQRTRFITDYRSDITTKNRLVCDERVYEIIAVTDFESGRERDTQIMCNMIENELWT
jgi:SPP1 family predicted phage head-tail adaptor